MVVIIGLIVLVVAVVAAVAGVATNTGSTHGLGDKFGIFGQHLNNASTGQLFLYGIILGVAGMLGLIMLLGAFGRKMASWGSRRELKASRRENEILRSDRDRVTQQLDDERNQRNRADEERTPPPNAT